MKNLSENAKQFAEACCDDNNVAELKTFLSGKVDLLDCKTWKISEIEWRQAIEAAIVELQAY
jgi:hypothetical protein